MPLYDYQCDGCGVRFERSHGMSEPPVKECPSCGGDKVRKLFTTGGILGGGGGGAQDFTPPMPSCATGGCGGGMCGLG